jgi:hypothetical protein
MFALVITPVIKGITDVLGMGLGEGGLKLVEVQEKADAVCYTAYVKRGRIMDVVTNCLQ